MTKGMTKSFLIFFGPPGSGKGTQAQLAAKKLKLPVISTGDLLRQELKKKSQLGKIAKRYMDKGKLVRDEILEEMVARRLKKSDAAAGAIFDGYPRNANQQDFLLSKLRNVEKRGGKLLALLVDVSDREVASRLGGRRACVCGAVYHLKFNPPKRVGVCDRDGKKLFIRDDDKPRVIADRLKVYHRQSRSVLDYWQKSGKFIRIDGEQSIEKVWQDIEKSLKNFL